MDYFIVITIQTLSNVFTATFVQTLSKSATEEEKFTWALNKAKERFNIPACNVSVLFYSCKPN